MAEAVQKVPCPCSESPEESLSRPTEESNKPDENNNIINSVSLGKDLSNVTEKIGDLKLESVSDAALLSQFDDILRYFQNMNRTLKDKDTGEREKQIEQVSKKIKNEIRKRNTHSEYIVRETEALLPRCYTHPAHAQRQENPTIKIEISFPQPMTITQPILEHHGKNNEETRLKCPQCCSVGVNKQCVENEDTKF